jgi:hypothetical protein
MGRVCDWLGDLKTSTHFDVQNVEWVMVKGMWATIGVIFRMVNGVVNKGCKDLMFRMVKW